MRERAGRPQRCGGQSARIVLAVVAVDSCRQQPFRRTRLRSRPRERGGPGARPAARTAPRDAGRAEMLLHGCATIS